MSIPDYGSIPIEHKSPLAPKHVAYLRKRCNKCRAVGGGYMKLPLSVVEALLDGIEQGKRDFTERQMENLEYRVQNLALRDTA